MSISIPFIHGRKSRTVHVRVATDAALQKKAKANEPAPRPNAPAGKPGVSTTQFALFLLMSRIQ